MISQFLKNSPTSKNKEYQPKLKMIDTIADADQHQYTHPLSPMSKKQKIPDKFRFVTEKSLKREKYEITRWQSKQLRSKLPQFIYWHQIEKGGLIQWNWTLLQSYLLCGADSQEHRALVEEYIATLPNAN